MMVANPAGRGDVHFKLIRLAACFSQQARTAITERDLSSAPTKNLLHFDVASVRSCQRYW
jgi:hypothetical protein